MAIDDYILMEIHGIEMVGGCFCYKVVDFGLKALLDIAIDLGSIVVEISFVEEMRHLYLS